MEIHNKALSAAIANVFLVSGAAGFAVPALAGDPIQIGPNFVVNSLNDDGDGFCEEPQGTCTLRGAILSANADPDASVVTFDPVVFAGTNTISLTQGDMAIDQSLTIEGPGADRLTIDAMDQSRHFHFADLSDPNAELTTDNEISGVTLINGNGNAGTPDPGLRGGAIRSVAPLTLESVHINSNSSFDGGGVWSRFADLDIRNSTLSGNSVSSRGGGVYGRDNTVTIGNTTISGNTTNSTSARGSGVEVSNSDLFLSDSTLSDNSSRGDSAGSIFAVDSGSSVRIERSIVSANGAADLAGGGMFELDHALVENLGDVEPISMVDSLIGIDPLLDSLKDNGGPTPTHTLLVGSPAIDAAGEMLCPLEDQRGQPRPFDGDGDTVAACDIGAVESQVVGGETESPLFVDGFEFIEQ